MAKNLHWNLLEKKYLIKDEWIRLRGDTYQMPNGRRVEPYYVLEYPDWVNVTAITEDNEVVMVRQYRPGRNEVAYELPGGMMDEGESSLETARRELLEETGFVADHFEELARTAVNPANHTNQSISILATGARRTGEQQLDTTEDIEVSVIPWEEVMRMLRDNEFPQAMHVASLFYVIQRLRGDW